jgi:hypothetical protein
MPEVHLPNLDEESEDEQQPAPPQTAPPHNTRGKRAVKLGLEVLLIATGVFLGLAGEQWREAREHRERAQASLRRFHTELADNQKTVAGVAEYHATLRTNLRKFLRATAEERKGISLRIDGVRPALFETTAWDLALATQALADIPEDVAYDISRVYRIQQSYVQLSQGMLNSMYINTPYTGGEAFLGSVAVYLDDVTGLEPQLLKLYEELLPKIAAVAVE